MTRSEYNKMYYLRNRQHILAVKKQWRQRERDTLSQIDKSRRRSVIIALGGICNCCGESLPTMLSLDHVQNDGKSHRLKFKNSAAIIKDVVNSGYDKRRFQVLCHNCNKSKFLNDGICEHKLIEFAERLLAS